jgi:hypothetical protein
MTDLLIEYRRHRDQGHGHWAACLALARRFDMDKATVSRVIGRAERAEALGGRPNFSGDSAASPRPSFARASSGNGLIGGRDGR